MNKKIDNCINKLVCHKVDYYKDILKAYIRTKKCSICGIRIINTCWRPNYKNRKHIICTNCAGSNDIDIQNKIGEYNEGKILYIMKVLNDIKMTFSKKISIRDTKGITLFLKCEKFGLDEFTEVLITDLQSIFIDEDIAEMYYSKEKKWIYCSKYINGEYVLFYIRIEVFGYNLNIREESIPRLNFKPREFSLKRTEIDNYILISIDLYEYKLDLDASKI
ncbi:hypothetical protein [uncultured Clostridium sp.]|uniref:hypothetical protein n=1 Tax=uncultured Clostridium sp. TaxID=59620 RepID=UPI0026188209|nr:hypothetical protein [uncultured Clostridium sp.]